MLSVCCGSAVAFWHFVALRRLFYGRWLRVIHSMMDTTMRPNSAPDMVRMAKSVQARSGIVALPFACGFSGV